MVNNTPQMTNHDIVNCNLYDHYISDNLRLSGSTFVGMICIKYLKVCKSVFCERNVSESHVHSNGKTWNKRTSDLLYKNPYFFVITRPNQMGS